MSLREDFRPVDSRLDRNKHVDSRAFVRAGFNPKQVPQTPEDQFLALMQEELLSGRYRTARALVLVKECGASLDLEAAARNYDRITELAEIARSIRIAAVKAHNDLAAQLWKMKAIRDAAIKVYIDSGMKTLVPDDNYTPTRNNALAALRIRRVAMKAGDFISKELDIAAQAVEDLL